jgi:galactitol-specific phosphotransferase system IIB component
MTLSNNKKLEDLFDLPITSDDVDKSVPSIPEKKETLQIIDNTIDKIEAALPQVRGLEMADTELDELAQLAVSGYNDLSDLGMQVDSRFAAEIFSVASNMLGHAITAKTAKLDKKLKMIDLQLKKMRLDQSQADAEPAQAGTGIVLNRNDLLEQILKRNNQNDKKE